MPYVESTTAGQKPRSDAWQSAITVVQEVEPPFIRAGAHAMTIVVDFPGAGDPGNPPHRHCGSCFGFVLEGENKPVLTFVDEEELVQRKNLLAQRTN
jgi:hypothetical protein